jgi:hypothetical protein
MAGIPSHVLNIRKIISMTMKNASRLIDTCALKTKIDGVNAIHFFFKFLRLVLPFRK